MSERFLALKGGLAAVVVVVSLAPAPVVGQSRPATTKVANWTPPRTAWGDPDLQGMWTNASFVTPVQQASPPPSPPASEAAPRSAGNRGGGVGAGPEHWYEAKPIVSTSQLPIVDPPDAKVPPLTPKAKERADAQTKIRRARPAGPEAMSPWDRCITRGVPGSMIPINYNNNYQILQSPGHVVILYEMIHDARVISLDGRPHLSQNIRQWMGDARGRWDGKTLVVETTNFTDKSQVIYADGFNTEALRIVERFTPVDANTMQYEFTVEDPATWTKPWTAAIPLTRDRRLAQIFEYACHEGNRAMAHSLSAARAEEQAGQEVEKKSGR